MVDNYRKQIEHLETDLQKTYPQTGAGRINISQVNNQIEHLETDLQKTYPQTGAGRINISQVNNQVEHLETDLQKTYPQTGAGRINISQVHADSNIFKSYALYLLFFYPSGILSIHP